MGSDQQLGVNLLMDAKEEVGCGNIVERDHDNSSQHASPENCDPFGGVRSPEENTVALSDAACLEFASKAEGGEGDLLVGPALGAVTVRLDVGSLACAVQEVGQIIGQRARLHARKGSAFRHTVWRESDVHVTRS